MNMLFNHPEAAVHKSECFSGQAPGFVHGSMKKCIKEFDKSQHRERTDSFEKTLDMLFQLPETNNATAIGFKWMVNQGMGTDFDVANARDYLTKNDVKLVVLERTNHLRQCVSLYDLHIRDQMGMAAIDKTGDTSEGHPKQYSSVHEVPMDFLNNCLEKYAERQTHMDEVRTALSLVSPGNTMVVSYSDMCTNIAETMGNIGNFLGFKTAFDISEQKLRKIHSGEISELVTNYEEIRSGLEESPYTSRLSAWEAEECPAVEAVEEEQQPAVSLPDTTEEEISEEDATLQTMTEEQISTGLADAAKATLTKCPFTKAMRSMLVQFTTMTKAAANSAAGAVVSLKCPIPKESLSAMMMLSGSSNTAESETTSALFECPFTKDMRKSLLDLTWMSKTMSKPGETPECPVPKAMRTSMLSMAMMGGMGFNAAEPAAPEPAVSEGEEAVDVGLAEAPPAPEIDDADMPSGDGLMQTISETAENIVSSIFG